MYKYPENFSYLQELLVLNLAENNIFGNIPNSMRYLSSLKLLLLHQNHLEGELPSFQDLGGNKFFGKLPAWVGEFLIFVEVKPKV
jgi:hypothetical protein